MSSMDYSVYVCDGCKAWHRQLFLLEHATDCPDDTDWSVMTRSEASNHAHDG